MGSCQRLVGNRASENTKISRFNDLDVSFESRGGPGGRPRVVVGARGRRRRRRTKNQRHPRVTVLRQSFASLFASVITPERRRRRIIAWGGGDGRVRGAGRLPAKFILLRPYLSDVGYLVIIVLYEPRLAPRAG
ncbi:hypothetical protein EVAR_47676_1 [Eumeta japonica]|uniref:Uncharacterized protein n=1 Tax=Eumeta variegata TaxID=151549 RepID=A0A4C1XZL4_EUMVA|nr:hypothetical protein EVAR_47676_1 [Eumeta japonica]